MTPYGMDPQEIQRRALLSQMGTRPDPNRLAGERSAAGPTPNASAMAQSRANANSAVAQSAPPITSEPAAAPAAEPRKYGGFLGMVGSKMNDANYRTPKYDLGRMLEGIGKDRLLTDEGRQELLKQAQGNAYFKNARLIGQDKLGYTGQEGQDVVIDFMKGSRSANPELAYLIEQGRAGGDGPGRGAPSMNGAPGLLDADGSAGSSALASLTEPSTYRRIMDYVNQLNGLEATDRNALMSLMLRQN